MPCLPKTVINYNKNNNNNNINSCDGNEEDIEKFLNIDNNNINSSFQKGLERVAEELMGRRKWKLYQEALARSQLNVNNVSSTQNVSASQNKKSDPLQRPEKENLGTDQSYSKENEIPLAIIKKEIEENSDEESCITIKKENPENRLTEGLIGNSNNSVKILNSTTTNKNITNNTLSSSLTSSSLNTTTTTTTPTTTTSSSSSSSLLQSKLEPTSISLTPTSIDWKPDEKCYFCVDGKLLTVNEKGELVAESDPALSEAELAHRTSVDSDSDSSDSSPDIELRNQSTATSNVHKTLTSRLRETLPPNMTSFESMSAQMAAVASIQGLQPGLTSFYPGLFYNQLVQQIMSANTTTSSDTPVAASSPLIKDSPSPSDATGEQPLDLSAKPSPNSSTSGDSKQIFRAKPRMTTISGRRTYTEEELHSALQDIISGKLGTRRAAVLYGIPRSTLRNKVYKISMEQKRETPALHQQLLVDELVDPDEEDKDLSGDEEKDDKILASSSIGAQSADDLARLAAPQLAAAALQKIGKGCDNSPTIADVKPSTSLDAQSKLQSNIASQQHPHTPPITPNPWLDPNVIFQSLLLNLGALPQAPGLGALTGLMQPKIEDPSAIRELFTSLMLQQEQLIKEQLKNTSSSLSSSDLLNASKNAIDPRILLQNLPALQHMQQQSQHSAHHSYQNRLPKSDTPETASSVDINEASDDPSVILKIPSFKPVAGSSSSGKNGESLNSSSGSQITPPIMSRSPQQPNSVPGISPPLMRQSSESQSPPMLSLRDVIANSISRTFSQQAGKDSNILKGVSSVDTNEQFKRASISVIKNIGGTDISRFAAAPNILSNNGNSSSQLASNSPGCAGGKGTRPKRGKYRNYDRDSLVEAVKAVQRGEMSVHRAGSYYGVPHSTLEYKVKERHLMRPRKREPKPQPLDDRTGSTSNSSSNSKNTSIPGIGAVSSLDKIKASAAAQKPSTKNNPPFPSTSPNGMKVPIFDQAMAAQFQYPPHLFWPHSTGFGTLPIDFQRPSGTGAHPTFPSNPENFLTSQMMQRFHEESNRLSGGSSLSTTNATTTSSISNAKPANSIMKNARQVSESLYDSGGANGSFLDGIIRQTLDRKTNDIPHGALLDQLVKNTRTPSAIGNNNLEQHLSATTNQVKSKRPGSPVHYSVMDIKRERISPATVVSTDVDRNSMERDNISKESAESLVKIREGLSIKLEDGKQNQHQQQQLATLQHHHTTAAALHLLQQQQQQHQQQQQSQLSSGNLRHLDEDLNGGTSGNIMHDKIGQIKSEAEDSL